MTRLARKFRPALLVGLTICLVGCGSTVDLHTATTLKERYEPIKNDAINGITARTDLTEAEKNIAIQLALEYGLLLDDLLARVRASNE